MSKNFVTQSNEWNNCDLQTMLLHLNCVSFVQKWCKKICGPQKMKCLTHWWWLNRFQRLTLCVFTHKWVDVCCHWCSYIWTVDYEHFCKLLILLNSPHQLNQIEFNFSLIVPYWIRRNIFLFNVEPLSFLSISFAH